MRCFVFRAVSCCMCYKQFGPQTTRAQKSQEITLRLLSFGQGLYVLCIIRDRCGLKMISTRQEGNDKHKIWSRKTPKKNNDRRKMLINEIFISFTFLYMLI